MNLIKPQKLKLNDKIGIIAPAGCVDSEEPALFAKKYFENLGYKIVFGKNIFNKNRYLAGTDEEKLEDLHNFFADSEIKAIFCLRGGYGAIRLLNKIDYNLIKNNPKIFAGYSDITALCTMFLKRAGLVTYHAPMFQSDFGIKDISNFTLTNFLDVITTEKVCQYNATKTYKTGNASGITFGGNLSTLVSLCGIDFIPDEDFIFLAEDLNEPVYKIDKMFHQLLNIEKFKKNIKGLILGGFTGIDNNEWLEDLFKEIAKELNVPTLGGFKISHSKDKLTIPIGAKATIDEDIFRIL